MPGKIVFHFQVILIAIFFVNVSFAQSGEKSLSDLNGPYFGQKPPGTTPEIFAPGIISDAGYRLHGSPTFSFDGKEVYWVVVPPKILFSREENGIWHDPEELSFPGFRSVQAPFLSFDGNRLYFQAGSDQGLGSADIWYSEKTDKNWSQPVNLGLPVNSDKLDSQPSLSRNGTLYFTRYMEDSGFSRGVFYSEFINNRFARPSALPAFINTQYIDYTPFISHDEQFLLFSSSRPTLKESDLKLYVCFKDDRNEWAEPINLSERLGLTRRAKFPSISRDEKYLFYSSGNNIFWVDAGILCDIELKKSEIHK